MSDGSFEAAVTNDPPLFSSRHAYRKLFIRLFAVDTAEARDLERWIQTVTTASTR